MASSRATAARCTCGYLFDASDSDERSLTLERIAREEKLFEEYLGARLAQAQELASVAAYAAELDPENQRKAIEASRANQAAAKAAAGLATQRIKAAQAAHVAGVSLAMRRSPMPDKGWNAKLPSRTPLGAVTRPTKPMNGTTAHPVALRPRDRWTPKHDNNRTMPPLRRSDAAPHTQTGNTKFAAAAGSTSSLPPRSVYGTARRPDDNKPPIPVLTMAVPQQALTLAPLRKNGVKVVESKMVFNGSPWRDSAKKMAAKAARRVARATARNAKKAATGIGRAAARSAKQAGRAAANGAKKAGRAAARGASRAARHIARAAVHTAKQAAHAVQRRRRTIQTRTKRRPPVLNPPPLAAVPAPALTTASAKPVVSARRSTATMTRVKPATAKPTASVPAAKPSPAPASTPRPSAKPVFASAHPVEPKQRQQPSETFRAIQAAKIEKAVAAARRLKPEAPASEIECALCSASLPADADRCLCGWRVPNHEREIPALEPVKPSAGNGNALTVVFSPIECPMCSATIAVNAQRCQCGWRVPEGVNELPPVALSSEEISALSWGGVQLDEPSKAR